MKEVSASKVKHFGLRALSAHHARQRAPRRVKNAQMRENPCFPGCFALSRDARTRAERT